MAVRQTSFRVDANVTVLDGRPTRSVVYAVGQKAEDIVPIVIAGLQAGSDGTVVSTTVVDIVSIAAQGDAFVASPSS